MKEKKERKSFVTFLIKSFAVIVISWGVFFFYIENYMPYFFNKDHPYCTYHKDFVTDSKGPFTDKEFKVKDPDVLFMGDSTVVYGIIPKVAASNSRNISMAGGSSIEAYYFLKHYYKNHSSPQKIFLSISHGTMEWNDGFVPRTMKLHLFPVKDFIEVIETTVKYKDCPYDYSFDKTKFLWTPRKQHRLNNPPNRFWQYLQLFLFRTNFIYYYHGSMAHRKYYNPEVFQRNRKAYHLMEKNLGFRKNRAKKGRRKRNVIASQKHGGFFPSKTHIHYVEKIMELASKHGTQVVWEFLPVNEVSHKVMKSNKKFIKGHNRFIDNLSKKFPGHIVNKEIIKYPESYMADSTHLNFKGATRYSKELKKKYFSKEQKNQQH
jgi:hypothetical protein